MSAFTPEELEGIVTAMSMQGPRDPHETKIPIRPPGTYGKMVKLAFTPLEPSLDPLKQEKKLELTDLEVDVEVVFGKTRLPLKELQRLHEGSLLPLENLSDDPVDILINGARIGKGEVVAVDDHFGVRIVSLIKANRSEDSTPG